MYVLGDSINGDLENFDSFTKAKKAYNEAIEEGVKLNIKFGDDEETALKKAYEFYYIRCKDLIIY